MEKVADIGILLQQVGLMRVIELRMAIEKSRVMLKRSLIEVRRREERREG